MKLIEVYDPPMCCATGVCGPEVNPELVRFAVWLAQWERQGVKVLRHNLAQRPLPFAQNAEVRSILDEEGVKGLPVIFVDGALVMRGRYPSDAECEDWNRRVSLATNLTER